MVIRCERCSTLYELDEGLLSASGSQVQCTRCQHLFTAYPPAAAGRTLVGVPAGATGGNGAAQPAAVPAPAAPALPKARSAATAQRPTPAPAAGKPEPKPVRTVPAPVYRREAPATGGPPSPSVARAPVLRRDAVGAFEARLRRSARMRWLAPVLAGVAVVVLAAGWLLLARRGENPAGAERREALALAALDDTASLDQAIARLEAIERRSPALRAVTADRAFVQLLRAGALSDEGDALAARVAARAAERDRLRRDQPEAWEQAERALSAEVQKLEPEVRSAHERSRALAAAAVESLRRAQGEGAETPEVARGLAAYRAVAGGREKVDSAARPPRPNARDPWLDLASAWLDAREPERAARERAVASLKALAASHPELLRGRVLLARAQGSLGHRAEAVATLDGVLAANGRHDAARRLREELLAPPAPVAPPAVAASPLPAGKPPPQPRKIVSQPVPAAGDAPAETADSPASQTPPSPAAVAPSEAASPASAPPAAPRGPAESAGAGGPGEQEREPAPRRVHRPVDEPLPAVDGGGG